MTITCIVVNCGSRHNRDKVGFYSIPTVLNHRFLTNKNELSRRRRALWLAAIKRDDLTDSKIKYQRVCSRHFIKGKPASLEDETDPDWVPSKNMGHSSQNGQKKYVDVDRKERLDVDKGSQEGSEISAMEDIQSDVATSFEDKHEQDTGISTQTDISMDQMTVICEQLSLALKKIQELEQKLKTSPFGLMDNQLDDTMWQYYTGFDFKFVNDIIFTAVEKYIPSTSSAALSTFNKLLLTLIKLRLDLHFKDLAYQFKIAPTTASTYFETVICILYKRMKPLIRGPKSSDWQKNIPSCFRESFHSKTTVIVDCFEIFIEKPSLLLTRQQCWSNYKHNYTIKYLIGITPQGNISYISDAWGGCASDKQIVEGSSFCDNIIPGDIVLADREFLLQDTLAILQAKLATRGKIQLHPLEIEETTEIGHVRIHVERVIGLIKNKFNILKSIVPISMLKKRGSESVSLLDEIVTVCSALVNISEPINSC